jgi:hypothetical protein
VIANEIRFTSALPLGAILPTLEAKVPSIEWWARDSYWSNQVLGRTDGIWITIDPDEDPWVARAEFPESLSPDDRKSFLGRLRTEILGALGASLG